jgi:hypothetical protein
MHGVEERHGARGQLAPRMRLTDPHEDREVGHDPEHEERDQPDVEGPSLRVGEERDAEPWNKPGVPEAEPARPADAHGQGSSEGHHG